MAKFLVTTTDNPFDPFTQFEDWYAFDIEKGYNTCSYLAKVAITSNELSEQDKEEAINTAVEQIVRLNVLGIYRKVALKELSSAG